LPEHQLPAQRAAQSLRDDVVFNLFHRKFWGSGVDKYPAIKQGRWRGAEQMDNYDVLHKTLDPA
jgi:hypothetical protein